MTSPKSELFQTLKTTEFAGVQCNLCNSSESTPYAYKRLDSFKLGLEFVRCSRCHLVYMNPRPSLNDLNNIFSSNEYFRGQEKSIGYFDYLGEEAFRTRMAVAKLAQIEKFLGRKGKLLEIGCAAGFFLSTARDLGWEVIGLDPSEPMVAYAQEKYGLDVVLGMLEHIDPSNNEALREDKFDVIVTWDTTSNFFDPKGNFLKVQKMLRKDGVFIFNACDSESVTAKVLGSHWHMLRPSVSHIYNKQTLLELLKNTGLHLKTIKQDKHYLSLYKILTKIATILSPKLNIFAKKIKPFSFSHRPIPIPNFGFYEIYAGKNA